MYKKLVLSITSIFMVIMLVASCTNKLLPEENQDPLAGYELKNVVLSLNSLTVFKSIAGQAFTGQLSDITSVQVTVKRQSDNAILIADQAFTLVGNVWQASLDLPINEALIIEVTSYDDQSTPIFSGSLIKTINSQDTADIVVYQVPIDDQETNHLPRIYQIVRPAEIAVNNNPTQTISFVIGGGVVGNLNYTITKDNNDAGTFTPTSGQINITDAASCLTIEVDYNAQQVGDFSHQIKLTNAQNNSITSFFNTNVVTEEIGQKIIIDFYPVITGLEATINNDPNTVSLYSVSLQAFVDYDEPNNLTYEWTYDPAELCTAIIGSGASVDLENYNSNMEGTITLKVSDSQNPAKSVELTYGVLAGLFTPVISEPVTIDQTQRMFAGEYNTLVIKENGDLWGIGKNYHGQLGLGHTNPVTTWTPVLTDKDIVSVAIGRYYSLALSSSGALYATGKNDTGQLGTGDTQAQLSWTEVLASSNFQKVAVASYYLSGVYGGTSYALDTNGDLWAVGSNDRGQLSTGEGSPNTSSWQIIFANNNICDISCGTKFILALNASGDLYGVGENAYDEMGSNNGANSLYAWTLLKNNVKLFSAGVHHSIVVTDESGLAKIYTNGSNSYACCDGLSSGGSKNWYVLFDTTDNIAIDDVLAVQAGWYQTHVLIKEGSNSTLHMYGMHVADYYREETTSYQQLFTSCYAQFCFALDNVGSLYGWGYNEYYQLGFDQAYTPHTDDVCDWTEITGSNNPL
jgi:hypothetical protein